MINSILSILLEQDSIRDWMRLCYRLEILKETGDFSIKTSGPFEIHEFTSHLQVFDIQTFSFGGFCLEVYNRNKYSEFRWRFSLKNFGWDAVHKFNLEVVYQEKKRILRKCDIIKAFSLVLTTMECEIMWGLDESVVYSIFLHLIISIYSLFHRKSVCMVGH